MKNNKHIVSEGLIKKGGHNDEESGERPQMYIPPQNKPQKKSSPFNCDKRLIDHEAIPTAIKTAFVDVKIKPLVDWMNGYKFIRTLFCCEGNPSKDICGKPLCQMPKAAIYGEINSMAGAYVSFISENQEELAHLLQEIDDFVNQWKIEHNASLPNRIIFVEVDRLGIYEPIRYVMRLTHGDMLAFTEFVLNRNKPKPFDVNRLVKADKQ